MADARWNDDESLSFWGMLGCWAAGVGGAAVCGCLGAAVGWLFDPCPMSVGDFVTEGMLVGIAVGFVLGAFFFYTFILSRKEMQQEAARSSTSTDGGSASSHGSGVNGVDTAYHEDGS